MSESSEAKPQAAGGAKPQAAGEGEVGFFAEPGLGGWAGLVRGGGRVWTGHQPYLWHAGVLAKSLTADAVVGGEGGDGFCDLLVDHDTHDAGVIELPMRAGDRWGVRAVRLGRCRADVPLGMQPAMGVDGAIEVLAGARGWAEDAGAEVGRLIEALDGAGRGHGDLAGQLAAVTGAMRGRWVRGEVTAVRSTGLWGGAHGETPRASGGGAGSGGLRWIVERMLAEPMRCVRAYNAAVRAEREASGVDAGVRELVVEPWRVEAPLWRVGWMQRREAVWIDTADSAAVLTLEDGTPLHAAGESLDGVKGLVPRALLMTAAVRARGDCGLFVHGTGGGAYDRITERWWRGWLGEEAGELAPMVVATADVRLDAAGLAVADAAAVRRAVWGVHHARHNVDRLAGMVGLAGAEGWAARKRAALGRLHGDGVWGAGARVADRGERARAWAEVKRANAALAAERPGVLAEAERALAEARAGVENAAVARKRDWSLGVVPVERLDALAARVVAEAG